MTEDPLEYGGYGVNTSIRPIRKPILKILKRTRWNNAWKLIRDTSLTGSARWLMMCLATFANKDGKSCYPANRTLANLADMSVNTMRKYRKELIDKKWIEYKERIGPNGQTSHEYTLLKICTPPGATVEPEISMYSKSTIVSEEPPNVLKMAKG